MKPVVIVLSGMERGMKRRDSGGNLPKFHIRLFRIFTMNHPYTINIC
jgi:hypothetical protein